MEAVKSAFKAKELKTTKNDAPAPVQSEAPAKSDTKLEFAELRSKVSKSACCRSCFKIFFVVLSVVTVFKAVAEIFVTVTTAIATRLYGSEQSGRLVAMVILAVLAAITISILIYGLIAVFKKQTKPLHAAAIVLIITAVVQAVVTGVVVRVTDQDELGLVRDLQHSYLLARVNNPRHSTLWAATQNELKCCGVKGPEDYRLSNLPDYFAPNVPISCCPKYDPDRSELVQERERENCKSRKTYYDVGCEVPVTEGFKESANLVVGLTVALIVLEVILAITASLLYKKVKRHKSQASDKDQSPKP